jgi:FkbM family methyltransferase
MTRIVSILSGLFKEGPRLFYKKRIRYKGYRTFGYGEAMGEFVDIVKRDTTINVKIIFEIGAQFGQDADYLRNAFKVPSEQIYVFEAHPEIYRALKELHKFNTYNCAVFNQEKDITFNIVPLDSSNTGISSILKLPDEIKSTEVTVQAIRMDKFMQDNNINKIDFLKLDVEGASYEVLEGFGERLKDIQSIHIESEHGEYLFKGETRYFESISEKLKSNGFEMVYFKRVFGLQSDSFWIKKEVYKY